MVNNNEQTIANVNSSNIFINLNSLLPDSSHTLDAAFLDAQDLLKAFAIDQNVQAQIVATAFGSDVDEKALAQWVQPWGQGDFSGLPAIEIRSDSELNGALGVYAAATDMIYLNQEFIASAPHAQIVAVMLEEIGHGLDARINAVDAPGDEGAIFAALVLGETLSAPQLQELKQEDDSATIVIDGQVFSVEQATAPINSLSLIQQIGSDIDGEAAFDFSGGSVSLSADGSVVAIGADFNDGNGSNSGHVRLYENNDGTWQQIGSDIDGEAEGDFSGTSVSLSADGSVVAIGAIFNDGNGDFTSRDSGHVRLYENNDGTWQQIGSDIDGEARFDLSGGSVSLSADGSVVAIGDGNGRDSGHVRLYENNDGTWQQIGSDIDGEAAFDLSGRSVSLSADGSVVAIGAGFNDSNGSANGHVRLYENNDGTWQQIGSDIDGEAEGDFSGTSVSLSADGSVVAIGAIVNDGNGSNSGHVRLYENNDGTWQQIGSDIDGEAAQDRSGGSVSLSADGSLVAIGAGFNDSNDSNGDANGHVRLYENNDGTWQQIGGDIDGEAAGDQSGGSVSLSADGSVVAIGARFNDGNGIANGHVRLYQVGQRGVEDTPLALAGLSVSDVDGDLATTQLSVANGSLMADLSGGATISTGANNSSSLTLSGSETQINAALATLIYQGNLNFNGKDTLTMVSTDSAGTPLSDTDTLPITIASVNDAPVATDDTGFTANNVLSTIIMAADLLANDTDVDNVFSNLTLTTVGNAVGGMVSLDGAGNVVFQANADFSNDTATFEYTVSDGSLTDIGIVSVLVGGIIDAGNGNDPIVGGDGGDVIIGGNGKNDIDGGGGNDVLYGGNGKDDIGGGGGDDVLNGGNGKDDIDGGGGDDVLNGGNGKDVLIGGLGNDLLTGGNGNDIFAFAPGDGSDIITDYGVGKDSIGLIDGLTFGDLTLSGNTISITETNEVLATLTGIDTTTLIATDFVIG